MDLFESYFLDDYILFLLSNYRFFPLGGDRKLGKVSLSCRSLSFYLFLSNNFENWLDEDFLLFYVKFRFNLSANAAFFSLSSIKNVLPSFLMLAITLSNKGSYLWINWACSSLLRCSETQKQIKSSNL